MQPLSIDSQRYDKVYRCFVVCGAIMSLGFIYSSVLGYGHSILKALAGGILLISEILLIRLSLSTYTAYKSECSTLSIVVIWLTIIYNIMHILYGCFWDEDYVALSFWGNPIFQPAFLLPVCLFLGLRLENFYSFFYVLTLYTLFFAISYFITPIMSHFIGLALIALLAFMSYLPRKWRIVIIGVTAFYVVTGFHDNARAAIVRALLGVGIFLFTLSPVIWTKFIRKIVFGAGVVMPLILLWAFSSRGFSIFEYAESQKVIMMSGESENTDTRTFLYQEVFDDLTEHNAWVYGKGINGKYYSDYFASRKLEGGDDPNRVQSEVGMLNILLKGGIVQAVFYLLILVMSIYNCFFRSNTKFMLIIGLVLLSPFFLLFVEEYVKYDFYNIMIWLFIGMSFSTSILNSEDEVFEEQFNDLYK